MKLLIFEQIGSACTRFRLETENHTFEIHRHIPNKCWMIEGYDTRGYGKTISLKKMNNNYSNSISNFKEAAEVITKFVSYADELDLAEGCRPGNLREEEFYSYSVGCNDYPDARDKVEFFCKKVGVNFSPPTKSAMICSYAKKQGVDVKKLRLSATINPMDFSGLPKLKDLSDDEKLRLLDHEINFLDEVNKINPKLNDALYNLACDMAITGDTPKNITCKEALRGMRKVADAVKQSECECGKEKHKFTQHSDWCKMHPDNSLKYVTKED